jgi:hypothetical protein
MAFSAKHSSTLNTVQNLGGVCALQSELEEAEKMYRQALQGYDKTLSQEDIITHLPALNAVYNLGSLFAKEQKAKQSRGMYSRARIG